jgi:quercetin dioxygenase-like cupin family protein
MSIFPLGPLEDVPNRPGRRSRNLVGSEHGFDSVFVAETEMDSGSSIPLHTHPIEEAWVVTEGELVVRVGEETLVVPTGHVVRVPPEVPHAVRNEGSAMARALTAAPWDRASFHSAATTYLEGVPPLAASDAETTPGA